jgi:hypothetical protein
LADIFVSYKTEDRPFARRVVDGLSACGFTVWWDQHIDVGESWRREITEQLDQAHSVVVIWTRNSTSVHGRFVQEEAARAQRRGTYIPLMVEECELPLGFSESQAVSLFHWSGDPEQPIFREFVARLRTAETAPARHLERHTSPIRVRQSERRSIILLRAQLVHPDGKLQDPEYLHEITGEIRALLMSQLDHRTSFFQDLDPTGFSCIFGIPLADELGEFRAIETGLMLVEVLGGRLGVTARIGIAGGTAVVAPHIPGEPPRFTSNLRPKAEGMLASAKAGQVVIPAEVCQRLAPYFETAPAGVGRFAVLGRTNVRDRIEHAQLRGTSFAGRSTILDEIKRAIERASRGNGQAISVIGDAGLGKSRLIHEIAALLAESGFASLHAHCAAFGRSQAHGPFIELLRQLFPTDCNATTEIPDEASITAAYPMLAPYASLLARLLAGSGSPLPSAGQFDGSSHGGRALRNAIVALVTISAEIRPLALVVDDFQFADEATRETIDALASNIAHNPVLLLVAARPDGAPAWPPVSHCRQIVLPPLDIRATRELLAHVTGTKSVRAGLSRVIHAGTDGIPLFIEELARALLDDGQLQITNGQLTARAGVDYFTLPQSLETLVRARLDRLDPGMRMLLQTAAVIGRQFEWSVLRVLLETEDSADAVLGPAIELGLIEQVRILPDPVYRFRLQMVQRVARESILTRERQELHRLIGHHLERLHLETLSTKLNGALLEELAHHFTEAEIPGKAVKYLLASAQHALDWGSARLAADLSARAVSMLEGTQSQAGERDRLLSAYVILGNALTLSRGYFDEELALVVEKTRALEPAACSLPIQIETTWWLWRHYYNCLMLEQADDCANRIEEMANATASPGVRIAALAAKGVIAFFRGEIANSERLLDAAATLSDDQSPEASAVRVELPASVLVCTFLGFARVLMGRPGEGWTMFDKAEKAAQVLRQPDLVLFALSYRQMALIRLGAFDEAAKINGRALELAVEHDRHHWVAVNRVLLGATRLARGDLAGAEEILSELRTYTNIGRAMLGLAQALSLRVALARGDFAGAKDSADWLDADAAATGSRVWAADVALARLKLNWHGEPDRTRAYAHAVADTLVSAGAHLLHLSFACEVASALLLDGEPANAEQILERALAPLDAAELGGYPLYEAARELLAKSRHEAPGQLPDTVS